MAPSRRGKYRPAFLDELPELLTPGEAAKAWSVDQVTLRRWADKRKISVIKTPGGHRRYLASEVRVALTDGEASGD